MTKTLKKQLFKAPILLAFLFLPPFGGFVIYAARVRPQFFTVISAALVVISGLLIFFRHQWLCLRAEYEIHRQDFLEQANLLEAEIDRDRQAIHAVEKKIADYEMLKGVAECLNQCFSLGDTSKVLSREVSRLFGEKEATVILYLFQSRTGELGISASQKGRMEINLKAKKGDIYDHWVVKNMQPLLIEDTKKDFRFDAEKARMEDSREVRSLMSVPLTIGNKAIGILRLDSHKPEFFHSENLRLLMTVAGLGVIAIENAQLYEKIEDMAIRDGLTGLFLRRHFVERLTYELNRELRDGKVLSFLMIDIDHFKGYNDTYGHMAGDIVLKTLALILNDTFDQPGAVICRYGGEEFTVLLPDCSKAAALEQAEIFREKIEGQSLILRREKTSVTVSIGVATFPEDASVKEDLIEKADQALYQAKKDGRNRVCSA